jgi:hypothetical protein
MPSRNTIFVLAFVGLLAAFLIYQVYLASTTPLTPTQLADRERARIHADTRDRAHYVINAMTPDPEKNQWRNERWVGDDLYCGEVNPTNRMGGYDGWRPYSWDTTKPKAQGFAFIVKVDYRCGP